MLQIVASFLVLTALLAYVNHRFTGLPTTIGVMASALALSLALVALNSLGVAQEFREYEESLLRRVDFSEVLMQGMLCMLLFAGALHVDLRALKAYRWQVGLLAVAGTLLSTLAVGFGMRLLLPLAGLDLSLLHCLAFGALISPTDPIAVMSILKAAGAPPSLEVVIVGESLFNDGVGVVIFGLLLGVLVQGSLPTPLSILERLALEAGGGIALGLFLGYATFRLLKSIDDYEVEVLLTLAAVTGGYALASHLHVSGPLAMVVAGLVIGNYGRALAMSDTTRRYLDVFWTLVDSILNAVLFVMIGMEVLLVEFRHDLVVAGTIAVAVVLLARLITVGLPVGLLRRVLKLPQGAWQVLTWGGLRGGISVALVLALPRGAERDALLALTYCVVAVSILVQGLTIGSVIRRTVH